MLIVHQLVYQEVAVVQYLRVCAIVFKPQVYVSVLLVIERDIIIHTLQYNFENEIMEFKSKLR